MGFNCKTPDVQYDDVVIVYLGHDSMFPLTVKKGEISQSRFGAIKHDQLVGHAYGTKYTCGRGWVYILQPTPELWTLTLPHRTQILYAPDIAMITSQLELKPGSVVCESGTGSASLSHAIIRTVAPTGHLHTVEFHEGRCAKAREEFQEHGLSESVTCYHRDVINDGFPVENAADAVFLDIPRPDQAIPYAMKALKKSGGRLCSFSPCIEQTQRVCEVLHKPGSFFREIETVEVIRKSHNVKRVNLPVADTGLSDPDVREALLSSSEGSRSILPCAYEAGDDLPLGELIVRTNQEPASGVLGRGKKTKRPRMEEEAQGSAGGAKVDAEGDENNDNNSNNAEKAENETRESKNGVKDGSAKEDVPRGKGYTPPAATKFAFSCRTCVTPKEMYGHTGYLTFATYCPEVWVDVNMDLNDLST